MKNITLLSLVVSVFTGKALADCFSTSLGYSCCSSTNKIVYTDSDGNWGIENNKWCGIGTCWANKLGYPCCLQSKIVVEKDSDGEWSVEYGEWCGI
ncbi:Non-catalytic module family DOC2, partial [Piromyces sp. E2]